MKNLTILLLALMLLLCSCADTLEYGSEVETQVDTKDVEDTGYESISRYKTTGYQNSYYGFSNDSIVINITYPS